MGTPSEALSITSKVVRGCVAKHLAQESCVSVAGQVLREAVLRTTLPQENYVSVAGQELQVPEGREGLTRVAGATGSRAGHRQQGP